MPLCKTLSKALDISKKTPIVSIEGFASKFLWISWSIARSWLTPDFELTNYCQWFNHKVNQTESFQIFSPK